MALADGTSFGPYRIIGRLGRGGMATVYRAYEPGLDRHVALKVLPEDSLANETTVQRFKQEARAVARLVHPNIVPVLGFGIEEVTRMPWMALQLVEGGTLAGVLGQGTLDPRRAVTLLRGIASALDYAHGEGVLHRDVKPQNVLVAAGDHVYLADFGLARMMEGSAVLSASGTVLGTPQYMAPEQALGQHLDRRCDIYALGIVAYELLSGAPPFQADTALAVLMKQLREPIPIPSADRVTEPMLRPVLRALEKDRDNRWPTALAFVEALDKATAQTPAGVPTMSVALHVPLGPRPRIGRGLDPARVVLFQDTTKRAGVTAVGSMAGFGRSAAKVVPSALLAINYALLLVVIKSAWFFFMPVTDFLQSPPLWLALLAPLVMMLPRARGLRKALRILLRRPDGGLRLPALGLSLAASLGLWALIPRLEPQLDFKVVGEEIDSDLEGMTSLENVLAPTVKADQLCRAEQSGFGCHAPLPPKGYLRLRVVLGFNQLRSFQIRLAAEPPESVAFARLRVDRALGLGAGLVLLTAVGSEIEIANRARVPPLKGTIEMWVICRQLPGELEREPQLRVAVSRDRGEEHAISIQACWSLFADRLGDACGDFAAIR